MMKIRFFFILLLIYILGNKPSLAITGYDFESKNAVQIDDNEIIEEGNIIQYNIIKDNFSSNAKVLFKAYFPSGIEIRVLDLNSRQEKTFLINQD